MTKKIKSLSITYDDRNADGVPEFAIAIYELQSVDDPTYRQKGRMVIKDLQPFDSILAATRAVLEQIAAQESITL